MEDDLLTVDIVAEPEAAEGEPPLAFAGRNIHELLDVVSLGTVVGIDLEDLAGAGLKGIAAKLICNYGNRRFTSSRQRTYRGSTVFPS